MVRARAAAKGVGANCCVRVAYSDESSERDSDSKVGGWDLRRGGVGAVVLCAFGGAFGGQRGCGVCYACFRVVRDGRWDTKRRYLGV